MGIDLFILSILKDDIFLTIQSQIAIIPPFMLFLLTRDRPIHVGGRVYAGLRSYLLFVNTDLKYIIGLFLLSLVINLHFNPFPGLLNYTNLTSIGAFFLSIPFCRRIRKLDEA